MYIDLLSVSLNFFFSLQGAIITLPYCFLNSEVRGVLSLHWSRFWFIIRYRHFNLPPFPPGPGGCWCGVWAPGRSSRPQSRGWASRGRTRCRPRAPQRRGSWPSPRWRPRRSSPRPRDSPRCRKCRNQEMAPDTLTIRSDTNVFPQTL